ncbi:sulfotransferase [Persicobacter sp. CCB-QB2]|uniref:sulfotransferase family protein n=1 Tax=Persicobacter sp. CCB-QB2 TaxID=1561025 RepID=UPI0006A98248|nr:sulfotransferase [Persicobacter sp. CCB-QB2]
MKDIANITLPDFLIIGAGKSGTTSLYHYLDQHPDIFFSEVKEPNFFALEGIDPVNEKDDPEQMFHYPWAVTEFQEYLDLFASAEPHQLKAEASTMYLYSKKAAEGIKQRIPEAKLIAVLRQPAERLWSRYLHLARENRTPEVSFNDVIKKGNIYWKRPDLIPSGFYADHLKSYFDLFPEHQIKILFHEDLLKKPSEVLNQLIEFLDLAPFEFETNQQFNKSGYIKNKKLDAIIGQNSVVKKSVEKLTPGLLNLIKGQPHLKKWLNNARNANLEKPSFPKELKNKITQEIYLEDIEKLEDLLRVNLDHWKHFN